MKALLVLTLPVSASSENEVPESGLENNISSIETAIEKTKRGFAWEGVSMVVSGVALVAVEGSEAITGTPIPSGTWIHGIGTGMVVSGCIVVWKARMPKKPKK